MLSNRRLIAFLSRVHSFMLMLYVFLVVLMAISSALDIESDILYMINYCLLLLSWTLILFGLWIILFILLHLFIMKDFPFGYLIMTIIRVLVCSLLAFALEVGNIFIVKGVSI